VGCVGFVAGFGGAGGAAAATGGEAIGTEGGEATVIVVGVETNGGVATTGGEPTGGGVVAGGGDDPGGEPVDPPVGAVGVPAAPG
jgi:hypothetical protein